jgi:GTPase
LSDAPRPFRSGFVSIVGRPNVGKSTLANRLVGQKVAIVSSRPQTTRNRILAVVNRPGGQIVLFDTPGIHKPQHRLNQRMVDIAVRSLGQAEVALWMVDVSEAIGPGDRYVCDLLARSRLPVVIGVNKIDRVRKPEILPVMAALHRLMEAAEIVPISALEGDGCEVLVETLLDRLPAGHPLYPEDFLSDQAERFFVSELVRERILENTRDELPYSTGVLVESFKEDGALVRIEAVILVERESQKGIVIGKGGQRLKQIGTEARREIEEFLASRVYLGLFVKVEPAWREDPHLLGQMGLGT